MTVVGTPYYMSPEVVQNHPYTFKSDVWALGCILYELCSLKHAFAADNLLGLVYKIVQDNYDPIPERYSSDLKNLIKMLLQKDSKNRPSVADLIQMPLIR
jgi:NIMA (never in mitosis gene a)-related kinase